MFAPMTPPPRPPHPSRIALASALVVLSLAACTTVKVRVPPVSVQVPQRFHYGADFGQAASASPPASASAASTPALPAPQADGQSLQQWWLDFHDPVLTAYIERGLKANTDVRIALDRIREARAYWAQARSAIYPNVDAGALVAREKYDQGDTPSPGTVLLPTPDVPMAREYAAGFLASWEVDIFGSRRNKAASVEALVGGAAEQVHGAQLMVAGDIATNYLEARGIEQRMAVLTKGIAVTRRLVDYASARYRAGQARRADVLRAQAEAAYTESQWAPLRMMLHQRLHRLATLMGEPAEQLQELPPQPAGAGVPATLPSVLPSEVLNNRPDVRGAEQVLRSRACELGEAKAQLFPKFYLGFVAEDGHVHTHGQPNAGGILQVLGLGVRLPLFNAGRLRAQIDVQDARLDAAAADYEHAILQALEDVEDAYVARLALDARQQKLELAVKYATESAQQTEMLYKAGQELLQPALEAYGKAFQREDELVQSQTLRATTTVLLYKAIGAGWSDESTRDSLAALDAKGKAQAKVEAAPPAPRKAPGTQSIHDAPSAGVAKPAAPIVRTAGTAAGTAAGTTAGPATVNAVVKAAASAAASPAVSAAPTRVPSSARVGPPQLLSRPLAVPASAFPPAARSAPAQRAPLMRPAPVTAPIDSMAQADGGAPVRSREPVRTEFDPPQVDFGAVMGPAPTRLVSRD